jgi:diguanylate cyclase (GGDEF)-like protein
MKIKKKFFRQSYSAPIDNAVFQQSLIHPSINVLLIIFFFSVLLFTKVLHSKIIDTISYQQQTIAAIINSDLHSINVLMNGQRDISRKLISSEAVINMLKEPENPLLYNDVYKELNNIVAISPYIYSINIILGSDKTYTYRPAPDERYFMSRGSVIVDTKQEYSLTGSNIGDQDHIAQFFNKDINFFVSDIRNNSILGQPPLITACYAVRTETDLLGIIAFNLNLDFFSRAFGTSFLGNTGRTFLVDSRGLLIPGIPNFEQRLIPYGPKDGLPPLDLIERTNVINNYTANGKHYFFFSQKIKALTPSFHSIYIVFRQESSEILDKTLLEIALDAGIGLSIIIFSILLFLIINKRFIKALGKERQRTATANLTLKELNVTDGLTGLYNRTYFEDVGNYVDRKGGTNSLIFCDLDGLKLINDAFGHTEGDKLITQAAAVLKGSLPKKPIIRIGGDEFAIILLDSTEAETDEALKKIFTNLDAFNKEQRSSIISLYISFGKATLTGKNKFQELIHKADSALYANKSARSVKVRRKAMNSFIACLEEIEAKSCERLLYIRKLCDAVAELYPKGVLKYCDLDQLVTFHKLGYVADNHEGNPTYTDFDYTQVGYRIAMYLPEISGIADLILKHNEYFDGSGLLGLSGELIPLECRIFLACRDFDNSIITHDTRFAEEVLTLNAGVIYDPQVVSYLLIVKDAVYNELNKLDD